MAKGEQGVVTGRNQNGVLLPANKGPTLSNFPVLMQPQCNPRAREPTLPQLETSVTSPPLQDAAYVLLAWLENQIGSIALGQQTFQA